MDWSVYEVFSVLAGITLILVTIFVAGSASEYAWGLLGGAASIGYGIYVASQDSGIYYFSVWIFILPIAAAVGAVIWGVASVVERLNAEADNESGETPAWLDDVREVITSGWLLLKRAVKELLNRVGERRQRWSSPSGVTTCRDAYLERDATGNDVVPPVASGPKPNMACARCNASYGSDARFCGRCGEPLERGARPEPS